jgi:hypothetical protein
MNQHSLLCKGANDQNGSASSSPTSQGPPIVSFVARALRQCLNSVRYFLFLEHERFRRYLAIL